MITSKSPIIGYEKAALFRAFVLQSTHNVAEQMTTHDSNNPWGGSDSGWGLVSAAMTSLVALT